MQPCKQHKIHNACHPIKKYQINKHAGNCDLQLGKSCSMEAELELAEMMELAGKDIKQLSQRHSE